jgi:MFS family permease
VVKNITGKAILIFVLSSSFYLYEFLLQVAPSVMTANIMSDFGVSAPGFALISAFYFYSYAPMQMPAGILFDRYGPSKLISLALLICALGCCFFASTSSVMMAAFGRLLIGFGSAFSFVGILILVARWFPANKFALFVGIAQLLASVGAICGESPLALLLPLYGWRACTFALAILGGILSFLVWKFVEDSPNDEPQTGSEMATTWRREWGNVKQVCKDKQTWWIALYSFCTWIPMAVFASLWSVPYLTTVYHVSIIHAANLSALLWIGVGVGSPLIGWLSDHFQNRRWPLLISLLLALVSSLILICIPNLNLWLLSLVLLVLGASASGQALSFAVVKEHNPIEQVGMASGLNNFSVVLTGAFLQPLSGLILGWYWDGTLNNGVPIYPIDAFNNAFWMMPIGALIGIVAVYCFIDESYGKEGGK